MDYIDGAHTGRRDAAIGGAALLVAAVLFFMPVDYQAPVRQGIRGTLLRPFLTLQAEVVTRRATSENTSEIRAERDSLAAVVAAQATLVEENRRLRSLLGLRDRAESGFVAAEVLRVGLMGGESTFLLDVGETDGVGLGGPVLTSDGLLGVVHDVDAHTGHGMDWTHSEFRASAMTADGAVYGIVEPRRGQFREEDLLALTGAPFHSDISAGTRIVTSGRGGVYPRGVPVGTVVGIEEADTGWRKSYLLQPAVRPGEVVHVLVGARSGDDEAGNLSRLWDVPAPADTTDRAGESETGGAADASEAGGEREQP